MQSKISRKEFNLSDSDQEALEEVYDESENVKVRERANALLLMNQGFSVKEVAQIIRRPISTIYTWISRWEERGLEGIEDRKSPGRPPIWTDSDQDTVLDVVRNEPRRINAALPEIGRKTGRGGSARTLRRYLKKHGWSWKRVRRSLKGKRDQEEFDQASEMIKNALERAEKGEIDVFFADETSFNLTPSIPYAWQPKGSSGQIEIPSSRSTNFNTWGVLNLSNEFHSIVFEGQTINSDVVVACVEDFVTNRERSDNPRPAFIFIDNASTHTSKCFTSRIEEWAERGVHVKHISRYSPELNPIEIVWRFIKYYWLPFDAYECLDNLRNSVFDILSKFGTGSYTIDFSDFLTSN